MNPWQEFYFVSTGVYDKTNEKKQEKVKKSYKWYAIVTK